MIDAAATALLSGAGLLLGVLVAFPLLSYQLIKQEPSAYAWAATAVLSYGLAAIVGGGYEPFLLRRGRQTIGKQLTSLAVIGQSTGGRLSWGRCLIRWAVPHGTLVLGAVLGAWMLSPSNSLLGAVGMGSAAWTAVYASALLDSERRGWHDRAAGTVVVAAQAAGGAAPPSGDTAPALRKPVAVVLMAAAALGAGTVATASAYLLTSGKPNLYDDQVRAVRQLDYRSGAGGDACWYDDGTIHCDLVSIGGLHWDTGNLGTSERPPLYLGPGALCALAHDGTRCWAWSQQMPPRPARAPEDITFSWLTGAEGFVCGNTPDRTLIVCWTIRTDSETYRQVVHRAKDGTELHMLSATGNRVGYREHPSGRHGVLDPLASRP